MFTAVFTQNRKLSGWVSPRLSFLRDYQWQGYCLLFVVVLILSSVSSTQHYPVIYKSDSSHRYNCPCPVLSLSRSLLFSPQTREKLSPIVPFLPLLCSDLSCSGGGGDTDPRHMSQSGNSSTSLFSRSPSFALQLSHWNTTTVISFQIQGQDFLVKLRGNWPNLTTTTAHHPL